MYLFKASKLDSVLQIISSTSKSMAKTLTNGEEGGSETKPGSSTNENSSLVNSGSECTSMEGSDSIREALQEEECTKLLGILPEKSERRNDREEIRRKLAMDSDSEEYYCGERVPNGKKPSLTTRLQSGMNLQICFMNETASDLDSQNGDHDLENGNARVPPSYGPVPPATEPLSRKAKESLTDQRISALLDSSLILDTSLTRQNGHTNNHRRSPIANNNLSVDHQEDKCERPSFFFNRQRSWRLRSPKDKKESRNDCVGQSLHQPHQNHCHQPVQPQNAHQQSHQQQHQYQSQRNQPSRMSLTADANFDPNEDFVTRHARLQAEARHALFQAKEMARMQMEVERQRKKKSPIADIVGIPFPDGWHHISRHILSDMNVAQLQVIVNDLHSQIESLNDDLVGLLLERDDLHMEQDSMLVDIEDLTRYLQFPQNKVDDTKLINTVDSCYNTSTSTGAPKMNMFAAIPSQVSCETVLLL